MDDAWADEFKRLNGFPADKAHLTAWKNGVRAMWGGMKMKVCPYRDKRNPLSLYNGVTGARGYRNYWLRGYLQAENVDLSIKIPEPIWEGPPETFPILWSSK